MPTSNTWQPEPAVDPMATVEDLRSRLNPERMPKHVAVIMDGNGRWAKKHRFTRLLGHKQGIQALHDIVRLAGEIDLEHLTIYAFSTENWRRSKMEVKGLLKLIMDSLIKYIDELNGENIRVRFIGSIERIGKGYRQRADDICRKTWDNSGMSFNIAVNYGGRQELLEAINDMLSDRDDGKLPDGPVTDETLRPYLYTADLPDPDLVIRTSGEMRLSNFLLWQSAYSELWFTPTLWPDFTPQEFLQALLDYQNRTRKFGTVVQ